MAIFTVNGQETDNVKDALQLVEDAWHAYKADGVREQHVKALQKPSSLDLQRAAMGIEAPIVEATKAAATLAKQASDAAAANAAANAAAPAEV